MGTRGFISFAIDGQVKTAYNHFDSYPDGLGMGVLKWLRDADISTAREQSRALRVVQSHEVPVPADRDRLRQYTDLNVGEQSDLDWYCLLRETQGNPALILRAGVIEDASNFPADSLFAEWGYVVDFDGNALEVYRGFQASPHSAGRFAQMTGENGYYPVALKASWPLGALPDDEGFISTLCPRDEDEEAL